MGPTAPLHCCTPVDARRIARVSPNTLYRDVQGEGVLRHLDSGHYFGLDEVGNRVWQLIEATGDLAAVEAALFDEFDVDAAVLSSDLERLVDELGANRLIEVVEA